MYNYFMLIGRLAGDAIIEELGDGRKKGVIKLKVNRPFSTEKGEYVEDVLNITFWDYLINFIQEDVKKGYPVMVKGRIQATEQGIELIGERIVSFSYE